MDLNSVWQSLSQVLKNGRSKLEDTKREQGNIRKQVFKQELSLSRVFTRART